MNKLSNLSNYLLSCGYRSEYLYLREVYAQVNPEEYLEENFPYVYSIYESDGAKPAPAYISMLNQIKSKFKIETDSGADEFAKDNYASSFLDIVGLLKLKKDEVKSSKDDIYKDTGISSEKISELKSLGASEREIIFILDKNTRGNHLIEEAAGDLINILKEKNYIQSKQIKDLKSVIEFNNLDDASDYFISLSNSLRFEDKEKSEESVKEKLLRYYRYIYDGQMDPDHDYSDYEGIKRGGAKSNSEIVGKVGDYTIIFSNSMEAAQYWERGSVEISEGKANFNLCTSRIYQEGFRRENLYDSYKDYFMFQFIKNFSGEPVFKNEANDDNDLITLCFNYNSSEAKYSVMWEGSTTVNSKDNPISEDEFKKSFLSAHEAEKALDLCRSFIGSKGSLVSAKHEANLKAAFKNWKYGEADICVSVDEDLLQDIIIEIGYKIVYSDAVNLPCVRSKINDPEFKKLLFENVVGRDGGILKHIDKYPRIEEIFYKEEIDSDTFFNYNFYKSPDFKDLKIFHAEKLKVKSFFWRKLHLDPDLEEISRLKAKDLTSTRFFREKIYEHLNSKDLKIFHAEKLAPRMFFKFKLNEDPDLKSIAKLNAEELTPNSFFGLELNEDPNLKGITKLYLEKIKDDADTDTDFLLKKLIYEFPDGSSLIDEFADKKQLILSLFEKVTPRQFFNLNRFYNILDRFPELKHLALQKAINLDPHAFFSDNVHHIPEFKHLISQNAINLHPYNFLYNGLYNDVELQKIPEYVDIVARAASNEFLYENIHLRPPYSLEEDTYEDKLAKAADKVNASDFFSKSLHEIPELKHLVLSKAESLDPSRFFELKLHKIPELKDVAATKSKEIGNNR